MHWQNYKEPVTSQIPKSRVSGPEVSIQFYSSSPGASVSQQQCFDQISQGCCPFMVLQIVKTHSQGRQKDGQLPLPVCPSSPLISIGSFPSSPVVHAYDFYSKIPGNFKGTRYKLVQTILYLVHGPNSHLTCLPHP